LGQASIPVINRTGYSMYWLSSWDDLHSFSKYFNEDIHIRSFFDEIFRKKMSTKFIFWKKKKDHIVKYNEFLKRYRLYLRHSVSFKQVPKFLKRFYKIPYYWSKIRIIRFQKWLIIYLTLFSTNRVKLRYNFPRNQLYENAVLYNKILLKQSFLPNLLFDF